MQPRPLLFALLGGLAATGAGFLACGGGGNATQGDAGLDTGTPPSMEATVFDTSTPDTGVNIPDTSPGDTSLHDAGADRVTPHDAAKSDAFVGACSLVTGTCDIVAQNCEAGNECDIVTTMDGSLGTACEPTTAAEHLAKGAACCPSGSNSCDPGLECNGGNDCTPDAAPPGPGLPAGWGGSRCTPRCCPADGGGGPSNCGTAGDGGAQGQCDLSITFTNGGPGEYNVCTYPTTCEPLGIHPCASGFSCEVENAAGTSACTVIYNPGSDAALGATAGQACMYANQCADGLGCFGTTTSTCLWLCHIPNSATPFDAGALSATPGKGGCPTGSTCEGVTGFPAWLGVCSP